MALAIILTVVFGFVGFNGAIGGLMAGYGGQYALGAILPFFLLLVITLDQYDKLKKEQSKSGNAPD